MENNSLLAKDVPRNIHGALVTTRVLLPPVVGFHSIEDFLRIATTAWKNESCSELSFISNCVSSTPPGLCDWLSIFEAHERIWVGFITSFCRIILESVSRSLPKLGSRVIICFYRTNFYWQIPAWKEIKQHPSRCIPTFRSRETSKFKYRTLKDT